MLALVRVCLQECARVLVRVLLLRVHVSVYVVCNLKWNEIHRA